MLSIIIPAYKSTKYIDECINSLRGYSTFEILIGIDCCKETLDHLKNSTYSIGLYYFTKNVGPYVIKNTLVDKAKYENILFFDSDDILCKGMLDNIVNKMADIDYLLLKYLNFVETGTNDSTVRSDAVIAIKKGVFNSLNGFQDWRCAADTELAKRLIYNNISHSVTDGVVYHRRIHKDGITSVKLTNHTSPLRGRYKAILESNRRKNMWKNPKIKIVQTCVNYTTPS